MREGVRLYVGGHASRVQGEAQVLTGYRCFTAAHPAQTVPFAPAEVAAIDAILDSGAFTDPPHRRLSPAGALGRQLAWEGKASVKWGAPFRASALVSYDLLIDEVWTGATRTKRRWSVREADRAVRATVDAAAYLASRRPDLAPRALILSCQGVDRAQYAECAAGVLASAEPGDWLGLGGWCILGRWTSWLPEFFATCRAVLPMARAAGIGRAHIFGVLYLPALGGLLWLADRLGMDVSTDSTAPILACTWKGAGKLKKAGARRPYWKDNVQWWRDTLGDLRASPWYREPPEAAAGRQLELWEGIA